MPRLARRGENLEALHPGGGKTVFTFGGRGSDSRDGTKGVAVDEKTKRRSIEPLRLNSKEGPLPIFKGFNKAQLRDLAASWSNRMSDARRRALGDFLSNTELALSVLLHPSIARSRLTQKEWHDALLSMETHARALHLAIERLPDHEYLVLSEMISVYISKHGIFPSRERVYGRCSKEVVIAPGDVLPLLSTLTAQLDLVGKMIGRQPLRRGVDKGLEYEILLSLVEWHRYILGNVSASENGVFVRFLKTLGPMVGLSFGVDLLKTVLRDFPSAILENAGD